MKIKFQLLSVLLLLLPACKKTANNAPVYSAEKIQTISAGAVTAFNAVLTGQVGWDLVNNSEIAYGMLVSDDETKVNTCDGAAKIPATKLYGAHFYVNANNLMGSSKYYYRAYLTHDGNQEEYGQVASFITDKEWTTSDSTVSDGILRATGEVNGHNYVDLGLSVMWATMNIGALKMENSGNFYAWGETSKKGIYAWDNYAYCNGSAWKITKYCLDERSGEVDNKTTLDLEDDVAHVLWGATWHMPTKEDMNELRTKCTWKWTNINDVDGCLVTGPNGNALFLPAAGYRNASLNESKTYGAYWCSTVDEKESNLAYFISFYAKGEYWYFDGARFNGLTIRPICAKPE